jgi:hypothetical protein
MNKRIKELALQANIEFGDHGKGEYVSITDVEVLEKFAELIVRQCGYHADIFESLGCPVDMDPTDTKPSDYIKKHFGVAE